MIRWIAVEFQSRNRDAFHFRASSGSVWTTLMTLFQSRTEFPKAVIFVRQYRDCSDLYLMIRHKLGSVFTEPPGYPDVSQFRMVEMYSRILTSEKREHVLSSFTKPDSKLRLVIATTVFGLGIDCPDIRRIMHWGWWSMKLTVLKHGEMSLE